MSGNPRSPRAGSGDRQFALGLAWLVLATVALYRAFFSWLYAQWASDRLYSHGFLVPVLSVWLVWHFRKRLRQTEARPSPILGGALLLAAAAALVAGRWGAFVQFEAVSFLLFLPGMILLLWGVPVLRVVLFPVANLQFMVPWLDPLLPRLQGPFQHLSAQLSVWIFRALGISVLHRGTFVDLPGLSLEVASECSGVHFVFSVMAIAVPLVYLTRRTWARAGLVLAAGAVITVLANGVRIAIDGCLGMRYGVEMLHGPGHIFRGSFVAQVGWVAVFLVNWLAGRGEDRSVPRLCDRWRPDSAAPQPPANLTRRSVLGGGGAALLFAAALAAAAPTALRLKAPLEEFPRSLGPWSGRDSAWPEAAAMFPGLDVSLSRSYQGAGAEDIRLFMGFIGRQRQGRALVSFHADALHDGAAYVPTGLQPPWPSAVGAGHLAGGAADRATVFWYQFPASGTARKLDAKLAAVRDALLARRSGGMVILVAAESPAGGAAVPPEFLALVRRHLPELMPLDPRD